MTSILGALGYLRPCVSRRVERISDMYQTIPFLDLTTLSLPFRSTSLHPRAPLPVSSNSQDVQCPLSSPVPPPHDRTIHFTSNVDLASPTSVIHSHIFILYAFSSLLFRCAFVARCKRPSLIYLHDAASTSTSGRRGGCCV